MLLLFLHSTSYIYHLLPFFSFLSIPYLTAILVVIPVTVRDVGVSAAVASIMFIIIIAVFIPVILPSALFPSSSQSLSLPDVCFPHSPFSLYLLFLSLFLSLLYLASFRPFSVRFLLPLTSCCFPSLSFLNIFSFHALHILFQFSPCSLPPFSHSLPTPSHFLFFSFTSLRKCIFFSCPSYSFPFFTSLPSALFSFSFYSLSLPVLSLHSSS